ncbi:MAG: MalY/PatB family protein [Bacteroidales bacterium]|jgi:cystathionine beta-lyase
MKNEKNNFDKVINRRGSGSLKYDAMKQVLGHDAKYAMWVADMDFKTPDFITKALKDRVKHSVFGYDYRAPNHFDSFISWFKNRHQLDICPTTVGFTPGVVPAVNIAVLAYTNEGDKILVQPPVYFPFFNAVTDHNRVLVQSKLNFDGSRLQIDFDDFEEQMKQGVKLFILSNPHNPGGNVWTVEELTKMTDIALRYNVIIVSDDIHCDLVYKKYKYTPIPTLSEEVAQQTVMFTAPSKTFNVSGLSSSVYVIPNEELRNKFENQIQKYHISNGNIFGNVAMREAYKNGYQYVDELMDYLQKNVDFVVEFMSEHTPKIKPVIPESTFLIWLDCRELNLSDKRLNHFFLKKADMGLNTGIMFGSGGEGFMRLNIGCPKSHLKKALGSLKKAYNKEFKK